MRIRHKPWAKPELEACPFYIHEPAQQKVTVRSEDNEQIGEPQCRI